MKSDTITVEKLFKDRRLYRVPFYQRSYVWTLEDQWEQLWDDMREKAESRLTGGKSTPHFLGAVVLDPQTKEGLIGVEVHHIIDGQQRLSTLQFILTALLMSLRRMGAKDLVAVVTECVRNNNPDTMRDSAVEVYKVWPTFRDQSNFRLVLQAQDLEDLRVRFQAHFTAAGGLRKVGVDHPPALAAVWYFATAFDEWLGSDEKEGRERAVALIQGILHDLKVVTIVLGTEDDAQVIFETLNGRGAQLHATDLIRNFIFMRAEEDEADSAALYEALWTPFESEYWAEEQRRGRLKKPRMEWLVHASLQAELHDEVDLGRLYFEYRRFAATREPNLNAEGQLLRLSEYGKHYRELTSGVGTSSLAAFGRRIRPYDVTTLHAVALMIALAHIDEDAKREMLDDLVSYIVRRAVCGLTQKGYNNIFLALLKQLHDEGPTPHGLRKRLGGLAGDASRWPSDGEFQAACVTAPLYGGRMEAPRICSFLGELEMSLRAQGRGEEKTPPEFGQLDVDHILPRSWYTHWPLPDGSSATAEEGAKTELLVVTRAELSSKEKAIAARQSLINTLGNLTLLNLSVNREAQNATFAKKKELLIANTNLRLNVALIPLPVWDEPAIAKRGEELASAAVRLWRRPS